MMRVTLRIVKNLQLFCTLLTIQDRVWKLLDECDVGAVRIVTFDMSRAFDCVPHGIIVNCIVNSTMSNDISFARWLQSYLHSRQQRVRIGETMSSLSRATNGVPLSLSIFSILGPVVQEILVYRISPLETGN